MAAQRKNQQPAQQLVQVYVTNGHRTSGGPGPGVVEIPADEAARVVANRHGRILQPGEQAGDLGRSPQQIRGVTN
jgi:hypothetical protein